MFDTYRKQQFQKYNEARSFFIKNYSKLESTEQFCMDIMKQFIYETKAELKKDYDEASYLYPFWQNYPPDNRGRMPVGDQFPWIEVGEQVFTSKLSRFIGSKFSIKDAGLPAGPDARFIINDKCFLQVLEITDSVWLFVDIKSAGPRDDFTHAVMSHNQMSGNGKWTQEKFGIINDVMTAKGKRIDHPFYCAIPPLFVLSTGKIVPVVHFVIKPVYSMLEKNNKGQPLCRVSLASIPNGILLCENPAYLKIFPDLLFPGKDDKETNPEKTRARVSFDVLKQIGPWRFVDIDFEYSKKN